MCKSIYAVYVKINMPISLLLQLITTIYAVLTPCYQATYA
jgi:hypothetical protein